MNIDNLIDIFKVGVLSSRPDLNDFSLIVLVLFIALVLFQSFISWHIHKKLNKTNASLDIVKSALNTDVRNNINMELTLRDFIVTLNLNLEYKPDWAINEYFLRKVNDIVTAYKQIKNKKDLLTNRDFYTKFIGNGGAEIGRLYDGFPKTFKDFINRANYDSVKSFKYSLLYTDLKQFNEALPEIKHLIIKNAKENIITIYNKYIETRPLLKENVEAEKFRILSNAKDISQVHSLLLGFSSHVPETLSKRYHMLLSDLSLYCTLESTYTQDYKRRSIETLSERVIEFVSLI